MPPRTPTLGTAPCECEHAAHFHEERSLTPNGNPSHRYGVYFHELALVECKTSMGTWTVCKDCATDCIAAFQAKYP